MCDRISDSAVYIEMLDKLSVLLDTKMTKWTERVALCDVTRVIARSTHASRGSSFVARISEQATVVLRKLMKQESVERVRSKLTKLKM